MTFHWTRILPLLLFVGIACGDTPEDLPPASDASTVTSLEDIGLLARMGTREQGSPAAVLHAPLDGVLSGDGSSFWMRRTPGSGSSTDRGSSCGLWGRRASARERR